MLSEINQIKTNPTRFHQYVESKQNKMNKQENKLMAVNGGLGGRQIKICTCNYHWSK